MTPSSSVRFKVEGYVIRGFSLGETSRIISLFTLEKGRLKCVAKGARKSASKKGGTLELFSRISCNIYQKENVELGMLTSADVLTDYSAIASGPLKFGYCSAFCEILDKSAIENQPVPELFKLTGEFFKYIIQADNEKTESLFWAVFIKTLTLLGYQPGLYECVVCGKENTGKAAYYDTDKGGIICSKDVLPNVSYGKLSAKGLKTLQEYLVLPFVDIIAMECSVKVLNEIEKFILSFANYHTGLHRNLKSFKFLSQLKMR